MFEKLVALQERLLAPNGCPWDREQTHESLRTYLMEETYEVLDAVESCDSARLADELGDLLLQIIFHSALARRAGRFDIAEVIERIHRKLVRRHPHVFGKTSAKSSAEVLKNWEQLKAEERRQKDGRRPSKAQPDASILDGVPQTLPAVLEAYQLTRKASRIGFDWDDSEGLFEKLQEEASELRGTIGKPDRSRLEEEMGDLLFVAVNMARFLGVDPEIALRKANRKFSLRFREMERQAARVGRGLKDASKNELEAFWQAAKGQGLAAGGQR